MAPDITTARRTVLVSNATNDNGLAAMASLCRAGFRVVGCDTRSLPLGIRSRYVSENHVLPGHSQGAYEGALLKVLERVTPDVFLALDTRSALASSRHLDRLGSSIAVQVPELTCFQAAYRKSACLRECRELNILCPEEYTVEAATDLLRGAGGLLTLVVKPDFDAGAANGVRYVRSIDELEMAVARCRAKYGDACVQEYIPGDADSTSTVVLLFSSASNLVAAFTARKLRQWPRSGGLTAASRSTADGDLVAKVLPFFEKWHWRGAAEVELKYDHRDGKHKLIEINPRYPGYLRFALHCGLDLPVLAARLALEEASIEPRIFPAYRTNLTYLNPGLYIRSVFSEMRETGRRTTLLKAGYWDFHASFSYILSMLSDPLPLVARGVVEARPGTRADVSWGPAETRYGNRRLGDRPQRIGRLP